MRTAPDLDQITTPKEVDARLEMALRRQRTRLSQSTRQAIRHGLERGQRPLVGALAGTA